MADVGSIASGGGKGSVGQSVAWKILGVDELQAKLNAMGKGGKLSSVLRSAVRAGANPVRSTAASNLVESPGSDAETYNRDTYKGHWSYKKNWLMPGFAKRHILIATFVSRDKQAAKAIVGPSVEAFYASQWVERGIPSKGYSAHPWLVPALESNRAQATDKISKKIEQRIKQLAKQKQPKVKR